MTDPETNSIDVPPTSAHPDLVLPDSVPTLVPWKTSLSKSLRVKFFFTGFIAPLANFTTLLNSDAGTTIDSPWQNGELWVYVDLLFCSPTFQIFLPLILLSMIAMAAFCFRPQSSRFMLVRFGLVTGTILSLMFTLLLMYTTAIIGQIMALAVAGVLAFVVWLFPFLVRRARKFTIFHLMILMAIVAILVVLLQGVEGLLGGVFGFCALGFLCVVGSAPTLAFITFLRASVAANWLATNNGNVTAIGAWVSAWFAWTAGFVATWKFAVDSVMSEYALLPTKDPNCFICSAAANGHPWLVHSKPHPVNQAKVNLQMCRVKFLEFVLVSLFPFGHHWARRIYNLLGPELARFCRSNRWLADAAFVAFKPFEWLAILFQKIIGIEESQVMKIYDRIRDE